MKTPTLMGGVAFALLACGIGNTHAGTAERATGEWSRSAPQPRPQWKLEGVPASRTARVQYAEVPIRRLLDLQRRNSVQHDRPKATQVGIARRAATEARRSRSALQWQASGDGGAVARLVVSSPDALALRVGLRVDGLDDRVELRFAGSDRPQQVVAMMRGDEAARLAGPGGLFWTPSTDGAAQIIEIYRPRGVAASRAQLQAPELSHLLANSRNDFKLIEKIGESGGCNVDTACRVPELGAHFVDAKNAVAHMQYVIGGNAYICTGTLLADTAPTTQIPFFYTAHHCFAEDPDASPVPEQMQQVANTLNTFWNYEATACRSGVSGVRTQLSGGATYLWSNSSLATDAMLLRLNRPAPAGAFFAGWNAMPHTAGEGAVFGIHHPSGDAKKVSEGVLTAQGAQQTTVAWLNGTTEGGSSGSALFTRGTGGWELRGGLYGGYASCANTGSTSNPSNWDSYSKFEVAFQSIRQHLAATPIPRNGSAPLIPPKPVPAASAAPAPAAAATPAAIWAKPQPPRRPAPARLRER